MVVFLRVGTNTHRRRRQARRARNAAEGRTSPRVRGDVRGIRHSSCDSLVCGPGPVGPTSARLATPALVVITYTKQNGRGFQMVAAWALEARRDESWLAELSEIETHGRLRRVHGPRWFGLWRGALALQYSRGARGEDRPLPGAASPDLDDGSTGWTVWGPPWRQVVDVPASSSSPSFSPSSPEEGSAAPTVRDTSPEPEAEP